MAIGDKRRVDERADSRTNDRIVEPLDREIALTGNLRRPLLGDLHVIHAPNAKALEVVDFGIVGDQVVHALVHDDFHRRLHITLAAAAHDLLFRGVVAEIAERHLALARDRLQDAVDIVEQRVALDFDAPAYGKVTVKQVALALGRETLDRADERVGLALRQMARTLHGVHDKHQIIKLDRSRDKGVLERRSLKRLDIEAEFPQRLDVAIDRLALRRDAASLEAFENLRHGQAGDSVGLLHEHLRNVEELEFLQIGRHGTPSLLCLSYHTDYTSLFPQVN